MKRLCALIVTLALCIGLCVPASAAAFSDVPGTHPFAQAIQECAGRGILSGYGDGTFRPQEAVTRAQFCVMLVRAFYPGEDAGYAQWRAVSWYAPSAAVLTAHGAMAYGRQYWLDPTVMSVSITRNDMARFIAAVMRDKGFTVSEAAMDAAQARIADYASIPEAYREPAKTVFALGILTGYAGNRFEGSYGMNRGQGAVVISRMARCMAAGPGTLDPAEPPVQAAPTTLLNGREPTEENVLDILAEMRARYPDRTDFSEGYLLGDYSPVRNATHPYFRAADPSGHTSSTLGCGGWATLLSDAMFGQTGFEPRKTTLANARPGDIMVQLDNAGLLVHVAMIAERPRAEGNGFSFLVTEADSNNSTDIYRIYWDRGYSWQPGGTYQYDIYTRYPG